MKYNKMEEGTHLSKVKMVKKKPPRNLPGVKTELGKIWNEKIIPVHFVQIQVSYSVPMT